MNFPPILKPSSSRRPGIAALPFSTLLAFDQLGAQEANRQNPVGADIIADVTAIVPGRPFKVELLENGTGLHPMALPSAENGIGHKKLNIYKDG